MSPFFILYFFIFNKKLLFISYEFPIQCSIFLCQKHDLFPSSFRFLLSLSSGRVEEEEFLAMVFGIRRHVAVAYAKLGHLVNSDAHTELSACLEVFVLSQIIKHYEKIYIHIAN